MARFHTNAESAAAPSRATLGCRGDCDRQRLPTPLAALSMPLAVASLAVALLAAALLALAALWTCRFVRYRRAAQLSHARWLPFEGDASAARLLPDEDAANRAAASTPDWPSLKPFMLSPIPEERFDSGRESESESVASARKDRRSAVFVVPYGSF